MFPKKKGIGAMVSSGDESIAPPQYKATSDPSPQPPEEPKAPSGEADLLTDAIAPLVAAGLGEDEAKTVLADIFDALGKCLRGGEPAGEGADDIGGVAV